jgi:CBS-domain-containing membrane protein
MISLHEFAKMSIPSRKVLHLICADICANDAGGIFSMLDLDHINYQLGTHLTLPLIETLQKLNKIALTRLHNRLFKHLSRTEIKGGSCA